jgi:hypothetical protein
MAKSQTSDLFIAGTATDPVRFSFLRVFKPKAFRPGQKQRFEATGLLDPSIKSHAELLKNVQTKAKEMVAKAGMEWSDFEEGLCWGSGNKGKKAKYDGYKDRYWLSMSAQEDSPPQVLDRGLNELKVDASGREPKIPFSGGYGILGFTLWLQDNEFGRRINANFKVIQHVKDGPAFGVQQVDVSQHFAALEDSESGDSSGGGDIDDFLK